MLVSRKKMTQEKLMRQYFALRKGNYLSKKHGTALRLIIDNPCLTDRELAKILGDNIDLFRKKRRNLLRMGLIQRSGTRVCKISGERSATWNLRSLNLQDIRKLKTRPKKCVCEACNGKGYVMR